MTDQLRAHLERIRAEVDVWLEWKKDLLGWRYSKKMAYEEEQRRCQTNPQPPSPSTSTA